MLLSKSIILEGEKVNQNNQFYDLAEIIESYSWNNSNSINISSYAIGAEKGTGKYYQISPKKIWRYDIGTKQHSLLQTLP